MIKNIDFCRTCLTLTIWLSTNCLSVAAESPKNKTLWGVVNKSMSELLDSGWQITAQSSTRMYYFPPQTAQLYYDEANYLYTLRKDNKYIQCILDNPNIEIAYSKCRRLN